MDAAERIAKNTLYLFTGAVINKLLSFIFIIYTARKLGTFQFGNFSLSNSLAQIVIVLADMGINVLAVREISRHKDKASQLVGKWMPLKMILSAVTLMAIFIVAAVLRYPPQLRVVIYLFTIAYILYSFSSFYRSIFTAWEKMHYVSITTVLEKVFIVGAGFIALYLGYGVLSLAFVYIGGGILGLTVTVYIIEKKFLKPHYRFDIDFYLTSLKNSYPFAVSTLLSMIFLYIDTVMLSKMRSNSEVGWYSAGFNFVHQLRIFASVFLGAAFPVFSKVSLESRNSLGRMYSGSARYLLPVSFSLATGGFILAGPLINTFLGTEYLRTIPVFRILISCIPVIYMNGLLGYILVSMDRQHLLLLFLFIATCVNIGANFVFIPRYGALAAAWTSVLAEVIFFILCWNYWRRYPHEYCVKYFLFSLIAALLMGAGIYPLRKMNVFFVITAGAGIYIMILVLMGYIRRDEFGFLRR